MGRNYNNKIIIAAAMTVASGLAGYAIYVLIRNRSRRRLLLRKKREITIVSSAEDYRRQHEKLLDELRDIKIMGLDCEWISEESRRPVSMLQLCTQSGFCILLRLHLFEHIPSELKEVLADRSVLKCGVGISGDASCLMKDYGLILEGCVDLRYVYMRCRRTKLMTKLGLSSLARSVLNVDMDKRARIRCSDWEADSLSAEQVEYAAQDALVAADIMSELILHKMSSTETTAAQFNQKLLSVVQGVVDIDYKDNAQRTPKSGRASGRHVKDKPTNAYKSRKAPLYENAQLHAPDGQLLCTCSINKARWYVDKGIGEYVSEDPIIVRLLFEPSGRPESNNYYTLDKSNICVVCGLENSHIRKHVVPKEYRRFFPSVMKEHKSHDILLLCIECHRRSGLYDSVIRERLARECDAPVASGDAHKFTVNRELENVRSCARALVKSRDRIPAERIEVLEKTICEYYNVETVTEELLQSSANVKPLTENESYVPHGIQVVRHMMEHGGLIEFERMWRQHFLDSMKPKFLPDMWTVDHNHEKFKQIDLELQTNAELREEVLSSCTETSA